MKTYKKLRFLTTAKRVLPITRLVIAMLCLIGLPQLSRASSPYMTTEQKKLDKLFYEAGLQGDRKQIPAMIQSLKHDKSMDLTKTTLLALARLGAVEALPEINTLAQDKVSDVHDFACATEARLIAENQGAGIADSQEQASVKVASFFQALGQTPTQLMAAFKAIPFPFGNGSTPALEIEELADMIYRSGYQNYPNYAALPQIRQMDFTVDEGAAFKIKMAALPPDQQLNWLLDKITSSQSPNQGGLASQLLLNLDAAKVGPAISDRLQEMDQDHSKYELLQFKELFQVLEVLPWSGKSAVQERFKQNLDLAVASQVVTSPVESHFGCPLFAPGY
jgi:hypothetical protein